MRPRVIALGLFASLTPAAMAQEAWISLGRSPEQSPFFALLDLSSVERVDDRGGARIAVVNSLAPADGIEVILSIGIDCAVRTMWGVTTTLGPVGDQRTFAHGPPSGETSITDPTFLKAIARVCDGAAPNNEASYPSLQEARTAVRSGAPN